jgi:toxin ParE1/3/4
MPPVLITPAAEEDLINIWVYIARNNEEAADRVYREAKETFELLANSPGIGTPYHPRRTQLKGVRFFPIHKFHSYLIYYREQSEGIEVIRVLHAHMEKQTRLEPEN